MKFMLWLPICVALVWACVAPDVEVAACVKTDLTPAAQVAACKAAAENGDAAAQFSLGTMYHNGRGAPQDYMEALVWYRRTAEQEDTVAQYNLGRMYANGQGVPQDYTLAHMWLNLAETDLEYVREPRDTVAQQIPPTLIAEAQRLAREWSAAHRTEAKMPSLDYSAQRRR